MEEKKKFEKPEMQVVQLKSAGVICDSNCSMDYGYPCWTASCPTDSS